MITVEEKRTITNQIGCLCFFMLWLRVRFRGKSGCHKAGGGRRASFEERVIPNVFILSSEASQEGEERDEATGFVGHVEKTLNAHKNDCLPSHVVLLVLKHFSSVILNPAQPFAVTEHAL